MFGAREQTHHDERRDQIFYTRMVIGEHGKETVDQLHTHLETQFDESDIPADPYQQRERSHRCHRHYRRVLQRYSGCLWSLRHPL